MPHLNPDGMSMDEDTDYASFEYQQFSLEHTADVGTTNNPLTDVVFGIEPLQSLGGLANNEVAELVAHRLTVSLEAESEQDQAGDSSIEARGFFGANFNSDEIIIRNSENTIEVLDSGGDTLDAATQGGVRDRDEIFEVYQVHGSTPFSDPADGTGGGGSLTDMIYERNWRDSTGRGPVLDSNDDVTIANRLTAGDMETTPRTQITGHLIWDIAETNDAGRQFSVPR